MREKGKTPENQLCDEEILSLQEKDFRLLMLKKMQDIGNKLEAKIDNLRETLSKEIQDIKVKQEEMQNTITEIKNSLEAANNRIQRRKINKQGGGQISGKYGCRTEKRKKIEKKMMRVSENSGTILNAPTSIL